jgi:hypothetical protein
MEGLPPQCSPEGEWLKKGRQSRRSGRVVVNEGMCEYIGRERTIRVELGDIGTFRENDGTWEKAE